VVELLTDLPEGVIGFRVSGRINADEYHQMVEPVVDALERGERINLLTVADDDFHGLDLRAFREDVKAAGSLGFKHRDAWRRIAVVTDKEWLQHGISAFGWLCPGELRGFPLAELDAAKAWLAA